MFYVSNSELIFNCDKSRFISFSFFFFYHTVRKMEKDDIEDA